MALGIRVSRWFMGCALAVLLVNATPSVSQAALLTVGGALLNPAAEPDPTGATTVVAGGAAVPFSGFGFTGTLTSTVLTGDTSNPFGADKLTFTYLLHNDATSLNRLHRLTISNFAGSSTDASHRTGGLNPTLIDRATADVIGFSFIEAVGQGPLNPGASTGLLVIQTNATAFSPALASVIDGSVASVMSFAPLPPIPEPATITLAGLAALGLAIVIKRRKK